MKRIFNATKMATAVLAAALLITSCKKDGPDGGGTTNPTPAGKLKKISGNNGEIEFKYNSAGKLQSLTVTDEFVTDGMANTFEVVYGAGDKIVDLKGRGQSRVTPQYTGDVIGSAIVKDVDGVTSFTTVYSYQNGQLKSSLLQTGFGFELRFDFNSDINGNFTKTDVLTQNPATGQMEVLQFTSAQYDGKANPLYELRTVLSLFLMPVSKNNIVKEEDRDDQGALTETREYSYAYNDKNLPKSATLKTTPAGGAPTNSSVTYLYQ